MGSKQAENTGFGIPCGIGSFFLKKTVHFCPRGILLTHLGVHVFGLNLVAYRSLVGPSTGV